MGQAPLQPVFDHRRAIRRDLDRGVCPPDDQLMLQIAQVRREFPVAACAPHRVAFSRKRIEGGLHGVGAGGAAEAVVVLALMTVEQAAHHVVFALARKAFRPSVVGQCEEDCRARRATQPRQSPDPSGRHQVEQRGRGYQVAAGEQPGIERSKLAAQDLDVRRRRQQRIAIDRAPCHRRAERGLDIPDVRAGARSKVHRSDGPTAGQRAAYGASHLARSRCRVYRLPQGQPPSQRAPVSHVPRPASARRQISRRSMTTLAAGPGRESRPRADAPAKLCRQ